MHFGPRLLAFAAFQKMICGVSYDKIRLGFEQMLGFPVARSTLCRAMQRLARRAKPTRDALVEALRASPVVYADETGWKQGGRRVWLWVSHEPARDRLRDPSGPWFRAGRLGAGEKLRRHPRGRRLGPATVASRKRRYRPATTICCTVATSYWRRPRAGRCASHAWSRPSSGTPSPCAIGAMLARSAPMACALPRDSSRRR